MNLRSALDGAAVVGEAPDVEIASLEYDSRKVSPGAAFFAFEGAIVDGHRFIPQAIERGAVAIVSERPKPDDAPAPWAQVYDGRRALATASANFFDHPDRKLKLIGVTGTNGKTTTVYLIDSILRQAGFTTGSLGTIEHRIGDKAVSAINTTPESLDVVRMLDELVEIGGTHASLEVSSHALEVGRIHGLEFHAAVFTNLTQDHLDFHGDMASYARAKRRLFDGAGAPAPRSSVINLDSETGREFAAHVGSQAITYSIMRPARLEIKNLKSDFGGLRFDVQFDGGETIPIRSSLLGYFNVSNILAAIGAAIACDVDPKHIAEGVEALPGVPGRFETVREGQDFLVVVDYAHTDNALESVISTARVLSGGKGRLITVFGCGGDRDRAKRPKMGEVAGSLSDCVIVTSDNPRTEDPWQIIKDAEKGLIDVDADYSIAVDRADAIREALFEAGPGDIVLLAGKGHETYQAVGHERLPFDDRETAREVLRELKKQ